MQLKWRLTQLPNFRAAFETARDRAGISGYNWHKTRQQAAMELLYEGYKEIEVMMIGGWKTVDAFRRYVRADEIMLQKKKGLYRDPDENRKQDLAPAPNPAHQNNIAI